MFWHIGTNNVILTTCFYTLANTMSILRRVLTNWQQRCEFYDVFWHIGKNNVHFTVCFHIFTKKMQILCHVVDGPNAGVQYYCTIFSEMYEKRRRDAPGTFRNPAGKIRHLLVKKISFVRRVFAYLRKQTSIVRRVLTHWQKSRQVYDVFWPIFETHVNFTTCSWGSERWSTVLLHDFSEKVRKT